MKEFDVRQAQSQMKKHKVDDENDPFFQMYPQDEDSDLHLPNVIILLSDNVRLIRNNSVPMLQV